MRYRDRTKWEEQVYELQRDGELGEKFLEFFEFWMNSASRLQAELANHTAEDAADAIRVGLQETERSFGFLSVEWIGQMLTLAVMHWEYGDDLNSEHGLTVIERRVMEQETARKLLQLQSEAARVSPEGEE